MTTLMRRQTAITYEKATILTPDHPRPSPPSSTQLAFGRRKSDKGAAKNTYLKRTPPRPT